MNSKNPRFVPKGWALPETIVRRLGDEIGRQRLMDEDGHLLVLLHAPPKSEHNEERHPAVFWRKPDGEWKSAPESGGLLALKALLSSYMDLATELDLQAETASAPRQFFRVIRELAPLHRSSRHLLEVMEELRKARPEERELILLRDEAVSGEIGVMRALVVGSGAAPAWIARVSKFWVMGRPLRLVACDLARRVWRGPAWETTERPQNCWAEA